MDIHIKQVNKHFEGYHALNGINLDIPSGQFYALLGPSGCGKTTLLRIIAGLEYMDSGKIIFDNQDVTHLSVRERNIGFVFQNYALFRNMTVFENIAFGLKVLPRKKRPNKLTIQKKVRDLLELVQLDWLENAYPSKLSGGQKQRIALARSLAVSPKVLLLDEPFGALDAKVRKELRLSLRQIHHELNITSILVTHDQEEALEMADEIVVMNRGIIDQIGKGEELYHRPKNAYVAEFLGDVNLFDEARIQEKSLVIGDYIVKAPALFENKEESVVAYVRPHDIELKREFESCNAIGTAVIYDIQQIGPVVRILLDYANKEKKIEVSMTQEEFYHSEYKVGEKVAFQPKKFNVFELPNVVDYII